MRMSKEGLAFLAREEGLRLAPYNDSAGHATIGVGHLIHHGPFTAEDRRRYRGFTHGEALGLLARDVRTREDAVKALVTVRLIQDEFDALVSLVFNIGVGAFADSTVLRKLNLGDRRGAARAFLMWKVGGPGLIFRRRRERALFLKGAGATRLTKAEAKTVRLLAGVRKRPSTPARRVEIGRYKLTIRGYRAAIKVAAAATGWDRLDRRRRYATLLQAYKP